MEGDAAQPVPSLAFHLRLTLSLTIGVGAFVMPIFTSLFLKFFQSEPTTETLHHGRTTGNESSPIVASSQNPDTVTIYSPGTSNFIFIFPFESGVSSPIAADKEPSALTVLTVRTSLPEVAFTGAEAGAAVVVPAMVFIAIKPFKVSSNS